MTRLAYTMLRDAAYTRRNANIIAIFGEDFWADDPELGHMTEDEAEAILADSAYEVAEGLFAAMFDPIPVPINPDDFIFDLEIDDEDILI